MQASNHLSNPATFNSAELKFSIILRIGHHFYIIYIHNVYIFSTLTVNFLSLCWIADILKTHSETRCPPFFEWLFEGNVCCTHWSLGYTPLWFGRLLWRRVLSWGCSASSITWCFHGRQTIHRFSSSGTKIACGHWSIWMLGSDSPITIYPPCKGICCHSTFVTTCFAKYDKNLSYLVTWQMTTLSLTEL